MLRRNAKPVAAGPGRAVAAALQQSFKPLIRIV
jgi:hypothetical protein